MTESSLKRSRLEFDQEVVAAQERSCSAASSVSAPSLRVSHHKVGGDEWLLSQQKLRRGPQSLGELMDWPRDLADALWGPTTATSPTQGQLRLQRLQQVTLKGLQVLTDFSGVGSPEEALWEMFQAAGLPPPEYFRSCDVDASCLRLLASDHRTRAQHVFQDILDRLPAKAQQSLAHVRGEMSVEASEFIQKYLHRRKQHCFTAENARSAGCLIHREQESRPQPCALVCP